MASTTETPKPSSANNTVISDDQWEKMKSMISDQLDSVTANLDELRENGSLETIAQMIKRGDRCPTARLQSWYHGMLEVEYCNRPYSVSQKLKYMYRTHAQCGPDETPQSFILETNLTAQPSGKEEWKRRSGRPLEGPESVVARLEGKRRLSVVERQELWLAKKNIKAASAKALVAEEKMQERAQSAPDLSQSKRSYRVLEQEKTVAAQTADINESTERRRSVAARKRSITTATGSRTDINKSTERRRSVAARKRSISTATGSRTQKGSLGNITNNQAESTRRKRQKKAPITDLFASQRR